MPVLGSDMRIVMEITRALIINMTFYNYGLNTPGLMMSD